MSCQGYVPKEVWRIFGDDPSMANILYKYGSLAKHEVNDEEIVFLFNEIAELRLTFNDVIKTLKYIEDWADYTNGNSRMIKNKAVECLNCIMVKLK